MVCKYRKEEGLIYGTECSVCLSEFEEDEVFDFCLSVAMLFMYLVWIYTWLRSNKNCPLCHAPVVSDSTGYKVSAIEPNLSALGSSQEPQ